ncbi:uncharacterized protein PSFLO_04945 [Pseudozyma flocculosa]|uniref:Uncharacterized protein n=1 Tax=Pseudozyma flocculosa TaxID=84751 RepID=A0A5C3F4M8_9BASI|nr:uncharacterized protein PSFLO_04945 [Pseudozyma flocculosa]
MSVGAPCVAAPVVWHASDFGLTLTRTLAEPATRAAPTHVLQQTSSREPAGLTWTYRAAETMKLLSAAFLFAAALLFVAGPVDAQPVGEAVAVGAGSAGRDGLLPPRAAHFGSADIRARQQDGLGKRYHPFHRPTDLDPSNQTDDDNGVDRGGVCNGAMKCKVQFRCCRPADWNFQDMSVKG